VAEIWLATSLPVRRCWPRTPLGIPDEARTRLASCTITVAGSGTDLGGVKLAIPAHDSPDMKRAGIR